MTGSRLPWRALAVVLPLVLVAAPVASAFVLIGVSWPSGSTTYRINPNFPTVPGGTASEQAAAVRCGASSWRQQGAVDINFFYQGSTGLSNIADDGTNIVFHTPGSGGPGLTLAETVFWYVGSNLVAFDIVFYGQNDDGTIIWNGVGDSTSSQVDIIATSAHEFGHALGLDHTPISAATMYEFENGIQARTLHSDDIAGGHALYGENTSIDTSPQLNDVQPASGPPTGGNEVVLTGLNFTWEADTTLLIDGMVISKSLWDLENCTTLRIHSMPAHAPGTVPITIASQLGSVTLNGAYDYDGGPPELTGVVPDAGPSAGGTPVTVFGNDFASDAVVFFGLSPLADQVVVSGTEITGLTPPGSGVVSVNISQGTGSDVLTGGYTYSDNLLRIESLGVTPGSTGVPVQIQADHDIDLSAFSFGIDFDGNFLTATAVDLTGSLVASAEFNNTTIDAMPEPGGSWVTSGVVMDLSPPLTTVIPAGTSTLLGTLVLDVAPGTPVGGDLLLEVKDTLNNPAVDVTFVNPSGSSLSPDIEDGTLSVIDTPPFIRGDSNRDSSVDIADAIGMLNYLFDNGPGTCLDALDANDSGVIDIADPIYLLAYLFTQGTPPPAPFPGAGVDPTADGLDCQM